MVNPVGSYTTKYWYKKWIPVKENIGLSQQQKSLLLGSLLGDGTMRIGNHAKNANFKVEQGLMQKEYTFWKYSILSSLVFTEPKISHRYQADGTSYPKSWWFRTIRHPILTEIYWQFYRGEGYRTGKKIVPADVREWLDPLAFAVWIMDDGSYSRGAMDISTYSFSEDEIILLEEAIDTLYGIKFRHHKDRDKGYRMYCSMQQTKSLIPIISPHIIPSMEYKIGL